MIGLVKQDKMQQMSSGPADDFTLKDPSSDYMKLKFEGDFVLVE